jgi:hypothetical protein
MGAESRRIAKNHSWAKIGLNYNDIIEKILSDKRK